MDVRHHIEGYRIAAACRLGDLSDDVARAARDEDDPAAIAVAICSTNALGLVVDGFPPPTGTTDVAALIDGDESGALAAAALTEEAAQRLAQSRQQAADEQRGAPSPKSVGVSAGGGSIGGTPVWLNLDEKRARARQTSSVKETIAAIARALPQPSPAWWGWLGIPFLAGIVGVLQVRSVRRRRKSARDAWRTAQYVRQLAGAPDASGFADDPDLARELAGHGLHPEGLAAAGVRAREVGRLVGSARRWLAENGVQFREVARRWQTAKAKRERLNRFVICGIATDQESEQLRQPLTEAQESETAHDALRTAFFDAATAALSTESRATLLRIRENQVGRQLPVQYLVVERTDEEWQCLCDVLGRETATEQRDEELNLDDYSYLETVRSDLAVWDARLDLNQNLAAVTAAWDAAIASQPAVAV